MLSASIVTDTEPLLPEADYGRLPFDLFMLEKWDWKSEDDDATQRRALADYYIGLGSAVRKRYTTQAQQTAQSYTPPTEEEVERILKPLQTTRERNLSVRLPKGFNMLWLRTCYEPGTDSAHAQQILRAGGSMQLSMSLAPAGADSMLDDGLIYNFPGRDTWHQIFRRLPALLRRGPDRHSIHQAQREAIRDMVDEVDVYDEEEADGAMDDLQAEAEAEEAAAAGHPQNTQHITLPDPGPRRKVVSGGEPDWSVVQLLSTVGFLFVADEKTLRPPPDTPPSLLLAWFDDCGRVVRQTRIDASQVPEIRKGHNDGWLYDLSSPVWQDAAAGRAYRRGGPCGPPMSTDCAALDSSDDENDDMELTSW